MGKKESKEKKVKDSKKAMGKAKTIKSSAKEKKVVRSKAKTGKEKTAKTVKKEIKKSKVRARGEKAAEKAKKKETKKVQIKKEVKAGKKKVTKKIGKKVAPLLSKKVEAEKIVTKPQKKIGAKEVVLPKKAAEERPRKVFFPEKEKKHPPLPFKILSEEYGEDSIALMIVDPRKLFVYWEVTEDILKQYKGNLNVRLYNVTGINFDGMNAVSCVDIAISNRIGNLYLDVDPEKEFIADIGIVDLSGAFRMVARSNKASTPRSEIKEKRILPQRLYETSLPIPPIGYKK